MTSKNDEDKLLHVLEEEGRRFLERFGSTVQEFSSKKRKRDVELKPQDQFEEWHGIRDEHEEGSKNENYNSGTPDIVFFSDHVTKSSQQDPLAKAQMKSFMSSKISKLDIPIAKKSTKSDEDEDERTNAQNDALLHKLVHTQLLSGSQDTELDLTPAQRRKALAGRVLELTGKAKLGNGEKLVREAERTNAAKRIREGIATKQRKKVTKKLEEAKNLGNYHPTLKKLFDVTPSPAPQKRERGLKIGVGKFSGGFLRLTQDDVRLVQGDRRGKSKGINGQSRRGRQ